MGDCNYHQELRVFDLFSSDLGGDPPTSEPVSRSSPCGGRGMRRRRGDEEEKEIGGKK